MNRRTKIILAVAGIMLFILVLAGMLSSGPAQKATVTINGKGAGLENYDVFVNRQLIKTEEGTQKKLTLAPGDYVVSLAAPGFFNFTENITIKNKDVSISADFLSIPETERLVSNAYDEYRVNSLGLSVPANNSSGSAYRFSGVTYYRGNTWLRAKIENTSGGGVPQNVIMRLVDGRWEVVIVIDADFFELGDLPEGSVPEEIVADLTRPDPATTPGGTVGGGAGSGGTTSPGAGGGTSNPRTAQNESTRRSQAARESCVNGTDQQACESYLRSVEAYFVARPSTAPASCTVNGAGGGSLVNAGNLSITFPTGVNEAQLATSIEDYIRRRTPQSPWLTIPNFGTRLVSESRASNVNPLLIVVLGVMESGLGTSPLARRQNNYFGQKETATTYRTFSSPEDSLFGPRSIIAGMPNRLANHPNYRNVRNMYEYLSVHVSGQILYPGDPRQIFDEIMGVYVSASPNAQHGPVQYWRTAMQIINTITGSNYPLTPPTQGEATGTGTPISTAGGSTNCSQPAGEGGWDLPGEGPNPMTYYSQLYRCNETPPRSPVDRSFAQTCDRAVGNNAFGSERYGSGTMEQCGCGPTSLAMVVATLKGNGVTPVDVARYAEANGGVQAGGCGSNWFWQEQATQDHYEIVVTSVNVSEIAASLRAGRMVIVSLSGFPTASNTVGHISVIRKVDTSGNFYFADSYAGAWSGEDMPETASRMQFTEAQLAGMIRGAWSVQNR